MDITKDILTNASQFKFVEEKPDRYRIETLFVLPDGDHVTLILKKDGDDWILSDEGATLMRLSYAIDISPEVLRDAVKHAHKQFDVRYHYGELVKIVDPRWFGPQLHELLQAMLQLNNLITMH